LDLQTQIPMTIIHHSNFGVWDLYQEEKHSFSQKTHFYHALPFLYKMIKDILSIPSCSFYLSAYLCVELFSSLLPAISLWFSGQLLSIVQAAVETRSIDSHLLIRVAAGRFLCQAATRISRHVKSRLAHPLNSRIKQYYSVHTFRAMARLDAPTFDDPAVQRQLEDSLSPNSRSTIAWDAVTTALHILATLIQLTSQLSVLISVLRHQRDGPLLALLSFAHSLYEWFSSTSPFVKPGGMYLFSSSLSPLTLLSVWAATTKDQDYIKSEGLKRTVIDPAHRNEIVAGGMSDHLTHTYKAAMDAVADRAGDFFEAATIHRMYGRLSISSFLSDPLHQLPQIVFTLRAVQHPASIPLSLASLTLITQTTQSFTLTLFNFFDGTSSIADKLSSIRKLYEVGNIPNQVLDGTLPFPEDQSSLLQGLSIQFIDVSFKYPGSESYALRHVSFKIEKGQLCVGVVLFSS
jgi:ABC-type multidrug transport system fused ATPase/permease subunit